MSEIARNPSSRRPARCIAAGLPYGPRFRVLRDVQFGPAGAIATAELASPAAWEETLGFVHPALLDGAMQLLVYCGQQGSTNLFLPSSVREAFVGPCPPGPLTVIVRVLELSARSVEADLTLLSGSTVVAHLRSATARRFTGGAAPVPSVRDAVDSDRSVRHCPARADDRRP